MQDILNKILGLPSKRDRAIIKETVLTKCPMGRELKKCPLKKFRQLSEPEQIKFRLNHKREIDKLYKEHIQCFRKRNKL